VWCCCGCGVEGVLLPASVDRFSSVEGRTRQPSLNTRTGTFFDFNAGRGGCGLEGGSEIGVFVVVAVVVPHSGVGPGEDGRLSSLEIM